MGKTVFVDLTHPFGAEIPRWPYFDKPDIVGAHSMAKGGVLTQSIKCTMHTGRSEERRVGKECRL